jgi:hypothetical protein
MLSATKVILAYVVLCEVASVLEMSHWLVHLEPRLLHIVQTASYFPPFAFATTVRPLSHFTLLRGSVELHEVLPPAAIKLRACTKKT